MKHKYAVGERVHVTSHSFNPVLYEIIRLLPEDGGEFGYRLQSTLNGTQCSARESEIRPLKAEQDVPQAAKAEHSLPKAAGRRMRSKFLGWWVLTIVLASPGAMFLTAAFQSSDRDPSFAALPGTFLSLTALAIYLHKLRPRQVYLSNRARAEALAGSSFTE